MGKDPFGKSNMKRSKEDIITALRTTLEGRSEILFAYVFGSFTEESKFRDLDVGVFLTDPARVADGLTYTIRLSGELEKKTGYPVDVILMNSAPDHLTHSISKGKVLVDRDEEFRIDWIVRSWKRYFDIQPKRRQAIADMFT
jgi:hypothetical protein